MKTPRGRFGRNAASGPAPGPARGVESRTGEFTQLFVSIGRNRRVFARDLIALFTDKLKLAAGDIGDVRVFEKYSFVDIVPARAGEAIEKLSGAQMKGRTIAVNYAKKRKRKRRRDRRGPLPGDRSGLRGGDRLRERSLSFRVRTGKSRHSAHRHRHQGKTLREGAREDGEARPAECVDRPGHGRRVPPRPASLLRRCVSHLFPRSLAEKSRHRKRRFFTMENLQHMHDSLRVGGMLYFGTDFFDYYIQAKVLIALHHGFLLSEAPVPDAVLSSLYGRKASGAKKSIHLFSASRAPSTDEECKEHEHQGEIDDDVQGDEKA